ncbi:hypothetical protein [Nonomuraea basaltis]|uniref:hypothetical protein n=1 Tax=Nonomuraea basaltis TaxID=2495887 RepID=UPI00110C655B|nr:hypothetical protein [Nonomuraea basaltis]TMR92406.1 hypothetical protein EJK15_44780 [Nonomuraea basaltis]
MITTYRDECGTHEGLRLHQDHNERPCGRCVEGESQRLLMAKLFPEMVPARPAPAPLVPITPEQAAENLRALNDAMRTTPLQECGSHAAFMRHYEYGEKPCPECATAEREYRRNLRIAHIKLANPASPSRRNAAA